MTSKILYERAKKTMSETMPLFITSLSWYMHCDCSISLCDLLISKVFELKSSQARGIYQTHYKLRLSHLHSIKKVSF